jgi:hypothetical protein
MDESNKDALIASLKWRIQKLELKNKSLKQQLKQAMQTSIKNYR